jgi:hypothetical protein
LKHIRKLLALAASLGLASHAAAAEKQSDAPVYKPSAEAVRSVWEFYFKGKGQGVVLAESKLCLEMVKEGENRNDCEKEVPESGVKVNAPFVVWQAYLVPVGEVTDDLVVQLRQGELVRETRDVKIPAQSIRVRAWSHFRIPKPGKWTLTIQRGKEILKSFDLQAT